MRYSKELLEEMEEYSVSIGLDYSLIHYPRTKLQADTLLRQQEYCTSDDVKSYYEWYKKQTVNDPGRDYKKAIEALDLIAEYLPEYNQGWQDRAIGLTRDDDTYGTIERLRTMIDNHHNDERVTKKLFIRQTKDVIRDELKSIVLPKEFFCKGAGKFFYENRNSIKMFSDTIIEKDLLPILINFIKL